MWQKVIAFAETSSNQGTVQKFDVDERRMREWVKSRMSDTSREWHRASEITQLNAAIGAETSDDENPLET